MDIDISIDNTYTQLDTTTTSTYSTTPLPATHHISYVYWWNVVLDVGRMYVGHGI